VDNGTFWCILGAFLQDCSNVVNVGSTVCDLLTHLLNFTRKLLLICLDAVGLTSLFLCVVSPLAQGANLSLGLGKSEG